MKTLVKTVSMLGAPLDTTSDDTDYWWRWIAREGDIERLKYLFDRGIDKDSIDKNGYSVLWHVGFSGNIAALRYLLELGVAIPTYAPEEREVPCEQCDENRLIIDNSSNWEKRDWCMVAIRCNKLEVVKLLDEYGSKSCKSF